MTTTLTQPAATGTSTSRRSLVLPGVAVAIAAAAAVTLVAAVLSGIGVDFELPDGGESIPLTGFTTTTLVFSIVGLVLAYGLRRWSRRPVASFVRVTVALTAASLVPPFLMDANAATVLSLVLLHVVGASIVIPLIARSLAD